MTLFHAFAEAAERHPSRIALVDADGRTVDYGTLLARSEALARDWAARGVAHGHEVLVAVRLGIDLYAALAALWKLGATAILPEPALGFAGLRHAAATTRPKWYLSGDWKLAALKVATPGLWGARGIGVAGAMPGAGREQPSTLWQPDLAALVSFTTGSTGGPKAIVRSHGFLGAQGVALEPLLASDDPEEVDLVAFPVFALLNLRRGLTTALAPWKNAAEAIADPAAALRAVEARGATRLLVPPTTLERMLDAGPPPPRLRKVFTGGGPVYPDVFENVARVWPGVELVAVYGSTEAEPIAHVSARALREGDLEAMRAGGGLLAGPPAEGLHVRFEDGEIQVAGDHVVKGYRDPAHDATTKVRDGDRVWHRTGDAGRIDAQGRVWLLGRHGGAWNGIHPFQVESVARRWPGVSGAALVADGARAVLALEGREVEAGEWRRSASERFPGLAVKAVDAIPRDARHASKVDRAALRKVMEG